MGGEPAAEPADGKIRAEAPDARMEGPADSLTEEGELAPGLSRVRQETLRTAEASRRESLIRWRTAVNR
eukprot:12693409-Alexandrium_andersonii.AAC.1